MGRFSSMCAEFMNTSVCTIVEVPCSVTKKLTLVKLFGVIKKKCNVLLLVSRFFFFFASLLPALLLFSFLPFSTDLVTQGYLSVSSVYSYIAHLKVLTTVNINVLSSISVSCTFLVDELSVMFTLMSVLVVSFMFLTIEFLFSNKGVLLLTLLLLLEFAIIGVFLAHDFLSFFFFFEATLLPMFCIILFNGSGQNTTKAAYWLAMFTLLSSIFFIVPVLWLYYLAGTLNFTEVQEYFSQNTTKAEAVAGILCFSFFLSFAIKVPIMPLHIWLPEVHVEAPTPGSMILASLLLKLGGYGLIRICLGIFPTSFNYILTTVSPFFLLSLIISALIAVIQTDTKKIIAYSSISHMAVALLGLTAFNGTGYLGAIVCMFAHSLTAPALFFLIGCLYDRYHSRNVLYFGGLSRLMPIFTSLLFIFILSNISFPGFLNFIGELQVIYGFISLDTWSWVVSLSLLAGIVAVTSYNFTLIARLCWGNVKSAVIAGYTDLLPLEFIFLSGLGCLLIIFGISPQIILYIADSTYVLSFL